MLFVDLNIVHQFVFLRIYKMFSNVIFCQFKKCWWIWKSVHKFKNYFMIFKLFPNFKMRKIKNSKTKYRTQKSNDKHVRKQKSGMWEVSNDVLISFPQRLCGKSLMTSWLLAAILPALHVCLSWAWLRKGRKKKPTPTCCLVTAYSLAWLRQNGMSNVWLSTCLGGNTSQVVWLHATHVVW